MKLFLVILVFGTTLGQEENCECVPYYQCKDGYIITSGEGLIDIRVGVDNPCTGVLDVCCKPPKHHSTSYVPQCGRRQTDSPDGRVLSKTNSSSGYGEFPWHVAILTEEYSNNGEKLSVYTCGGSLIDSQAILTAAHCVYGIPAGTFKVRAGVWDILNEAEPYEERRVARVITHKKYHPSLLYNDLAILILDYPLELTRNIDTICLPRPDIHFPPGTNCISTGWGKDAFVSGEYQRIMKKVRLPLISSRACTTALRHTRLGHYFRLHPSFRCAGGKHGEDSCQGDGGSALVCEANGQWYQVGIVAWGIGCGDNGVPGVYADVNKPVSWIQKTLYEYFENK